MMIKQGKPFLLLGNKQNLYCIMNSQDYHLSGTIAAQIEMLHRHHKNMPLALHEYKQ
ncbi:hypothetical protein LguiB_006667 [Lonicera macranthoides]